MSSTPSSLMGPDGYAPSPLVHTDHALSLGWRGYLLSAHPAVRRSSRAPAGAMRQAARYLPAHTEGLYAEWDGERVWAIYIRRDIDGGLARLLEVVAHECVHAAQSTLTRAGCDLDRELLAYHTDWYFSKIVSQLNL